MNEELITDFVIPNSVTSIGDYAFSGCASLISIIIPDSVTSIGSGAFYNCQNLISIEIPDKVTSIGDYAFYNCENLTAITIGDNVTSIGDYAFSWCTSLASITIPDSVTSIGDYAFWICKNLVSIKIPDSVTSIGRFAFYSSGYYNNESNWENGVLYISNHLIAANRYNAEWDYYIGNVSGEYIVKSGTKTIADDSFYSCESLESITIPDSVTSIGEYAFAYCESLVSIEIPDSVTSIGESAFKNCKNLTDVYITDIAAWCSISFPYTSFSSGYYCYANPLFYAKNLYLNGELLKELIIPDGVTSIGCFTFYDCDSITSVTIPDSVTSIGLSAFESCSNIEYVFYAGSREQWYDIDIGYRNTNLTKSAIHYESVDHNESWVIDVKATCTQTGSKHKECTVCGIVYETAEIPATGHSLSDWMIDKVAICTEPGSKHKECTDCGETLETAVITATGHTAVKDATVAATCTTAGKTEGSHCSVCGVVFVAQQTIPAKGHTASALKYNEETRTEYKECTVCKEVLESKYNPLNTTKITSCYNEVNGVQLKWNPTDDAVEYDIYRKLPSQNEWTLIATTSNLTYQDKNVVGNTVYQYRLKALDQYNNESVFSAQRECRFIATPTLKTRESAVGGVKITWEKVAGATSYRIYRRGAGTDYWYYLGDVSATQNTFFDKESSLVSSGNYYRYTVRASYSGKDSAGKDYLIYSGFDTNGLYLKYVATPKLTSISNVTGGLQIKWNAVNGGGDTEYRVYRRGAGSTSWTYLGTTLGTTWTDTKIANANGSYYRYTVRAVAGKDGKGWYSAFDTTGLYLMRLANPTLKSAVSSKSGITVKWGSVKGATSYYVYRKTGSSSWTRIAVVNGNTNVSYLDKTAKKGTTYTYTVRAVYGKTTSYFNSGISCKDKY